MNKNLVVEECGLCGHLQGDDQHVEVVLQTRQAEELGIPRELLKLIDVLDTANNALREENRALRQRVTSGMDRSSIIGDSPAMLQLGNEDIADQPQAMLVAGLVSPFAAGSRPQKVDREIGPDPVEPGEERGFALETVDRAEGRTAPDFHDFEQGRLEAIGCHDHHVFE